MPKISQLENRGADSILNVLYKNHIEKEFDITIQSNLYKMILKSIELDPIWDKQTFQDYQRLFPFYLKSSKIKINIIFKFVKSILKGTFYHIFKKRKLQQKTQKHLLNCTNALDVCNGLDIIFKNQIDLIKRIIL